MTWKQVRTLLFFTLALLPVCTAQAGPAPVPPVASSAVANGAAVRPAAGGISGVRGPARGSDLDEKRYAAREAASPEAKQFRGGDVVVITATTAILILLGVILLILIV
jgi:hypothetical protein